MAPYKPIPVFDTLEEVIELHTQVHHASEANKFIVPWLDGCFSGSLIKPPQYACDDFRAVLFFLCSYSGSADTFNAYRRELDRLIQWSWFIRKQSLLEHKREDIEAFVQFCLNPPDHWIGVKNVARFKLKDGQKRPNPDWLPFTAKVSKADYKKGQSPNKGRYCFSQKALKVLFGILGSFYNYLSQEELVSRNPVSLIRQKSKFIQREATARVIRKLSDEQWQYVLGCAKTLAENEVKHERTVFILSCLYGMYLRISELVANKRWTPMMGDFFKDGEGHWWFKTVGKGNKARQIAVSEAMLKALKHYRSTFLQLPPSPTPGEQYPLIGSLANPARPITSDRPIRQLVQTCFDHAADKLRQAGKSEDADSLAQATVHWLRHTGISDDVKHRPREHVRDDAGHSSSAITDGYIDVKLRERAESAKDKEL
jgi:site-specific recombinase XerD